MLFTIKYQKYNEYPNISKLYFSVGIVITSHRPNQRYIFIANAIMDEGGEEQR